ncbi:hypothetical protein ACHAXR_003291 [Thalassiosira sp. AJA248-18]
MVISKGRVKRQLLLRKDDKSRRTRIRSFLCTVTFLLAIAITSLNLWYLAAPKVPKNATNLELATDHGFAPQQAGLLELVAEPQERKRLGFELVKQADPIQWPNTIVTAYFQVSSKRKKSYYVDWMRNMLLLRDAMVIFTTPDMVETIQHHRANAINRTLVVPIDLEDTEIAKKYDHAFWKNQLEKDYLKKQHQSFELFWIWLSKSFFVTTAIQIDPFRSDVYAWVDIGCFRIPGAYEGKEMINKGRGLIPHDRILHMAHTKPNPPPYYMWNNVGDLHERKWFYHSGAQMVGYKSTWLRYHREFLETINRYVERNMFIGEDQAVLQSLCLRVTNLCVYLTTKGIKDTPYFGLRYALHHGGEYKLWYPPGGIPADKPISSPI